jgi:class 3 adenylate cyclase
MSETRKLAAILVSDVVGYSRLAGADEDGILARLRALRSNLIDPITRIACARTVSLMPTLTPALVRGYKGLIRKISD